VERSERKGEIITHGGNPIATIRFRNCTEGVGREPLCMMGNHPPQKQIKIGGKTIGRIRKTKLEII